MKKVTVTIRTARTLEIQIDESKIDKEWIDGWCRYIFDIKYEPDEIDSEDVAEADYPYINLAKSIAYSIHVNDADHLEGLDFQDITENEFYTPEVDESIPVHFKRIGYLEDEFDLDLDRSDL